MSATSLTLIDDRRIAFDDASLLKKADAPCTGRWREADLLGARGVWARFEAIFRNFDWDVVILKHGKLQQAAFAEPGGERLRQWIDACPNQLYSALAFQGGAAWRKRLLD